MEERDAELKPCPVCGGKAAEIEMVSALCGDGPHLIRCTVCGFRTRQSFNIGDLFKMWNIGRYGARKRKRLKNCPLCGETPYIIHIQDGYLVKCNECQSRTAIRDEMDRAIDEWNGEAVK